MKTLLHFGAQNSSSARIWRCFRNEHCSRGLLAPRRPGGLRSEHGSMLIISVVSSALLGLVLSSYLMLIANRNHSVTRAMAWNTAIPVLEAGVEEALTHLTLDTANPAANGWTADQVDGQTVYWKYRQLPDGSYYYVTNFNVGSTAPLIHAAGYVQRPLANQGEYISRLVEVTATNPPSVFMAAIAANGAVTLNGSAIVDGYDSTKGSYDTATNRTADGEIATNSKQDGAVDIGSGRVSGEVITGPGGSAKLSGGAVGDVPWISNPANQGVDPSGVWVDNTMNVQFQPNSPPTGPTIPLTSTHVGSSNVTYLTADSSTYIYTTDNFVSKGSTGPIIVTGNCTLYVSGNFIINGNWYVYIQPNASLNLYVGGKTSISGGGVVNGSGLPSNFNYYGLPGNTSMSYSGTADWVGTINAPQADFKINGSSSLFGAIICNSFTSTGSSGVHYDRSLRGGGKLLVTSWREL